MMYRYNTLFVRDINVITYHWEIQISILVPNYISAVKNFIKASPMLFPLNREVANVGLRRDTEGLSCQDMMV